MIRRGYGLIVGMGLGVGAGPHRRQRIPVFFRFSRRDVRYVRRGFALASSVILVQRLWWPRASGARELKARLRLVELGRPGVASELPEGGGQAGLCRLARLRVWRRQGSTCCAAYPSSFSEGDHAPPGAPKKAWASIMRPSGNLRRGPDGPTALTIQTATMKLRRVP
jgi:hypothetical protein